jgi:hypothetical protein
MMVEILVDYLRVPIREACVMVGKT